MKNNERKCIGPDAILSQCRNILHIQVQDLFIIWKISFQKKKIALMKFCRSIGELSGIERQVFRALDLILFKTLVAF